MHAIYTSIHVSGSTAKHAVRVSEIERQTTVLIRKQNMTATSALYSSPSLPHGCVSYFVSIISCSVTDERR